MSRYFNSDHIDLSRIHLEGFSFAGDYVSPFSNRFGEYEVLPYMDIFSEDVKRILFDKPLLYKMVPVFARHARITNFLNSYLSSHIGVQVFRADEKTGVIEELAKLVIEEDESRKTLQTRLSAVERKIDKQQKSFRGLAVKFDNLPDSRNLLSKKPSSGTLVSIEGVLNRVSAISEDTILSNKRMKSGIEWILSDFPMFLMHRENKAYTGDTLAIKFPAGLREAIGNHLPLSPDLDWYPYVKVVGVLQDNFSAQAPGIGAIEARWIKIRRPRGPADRFDDEIEAACSEYSWRRGRKLPFYVENDQADVLFCLYLMMMTYYAEDASFLQYSPFCAELGKKLVSIADRLPADLCRYYKT